jgi:benzoyl-CoA reductase subunit C
VTVFDRIGKSNTPKEVCMSGSIAKFSNWIENRHEYAREWKKRTGRKVVGYLCTYVPEEVFYAAGVLPVRIIGGHERCDLVEPHILSNISCSFCRDCLGQGLMGKYDYLDGIVMGQTCLHTGQIYWIWEKHIPVEYSHFIAVPHSTQTIGRFEYLKEELILLKNSIEEWIGKTITDEDLDHAIEVYNLNRKLTREIYEFRKKDNPPITGAEILDLILSCQVVDKDEHNKAMEELLKELPDRKLNRETGARLMMVGSINTDRKFMRLVEDRLSLPATFVIEDTCTGLRYNFNDVTPQADRLMAISIRYNHRPPCPNKDWPKRRRFPFIFRLYRDYKAQAVILMNQKFCHPHQTDNAALSKLLEKDNIPTLDLEFDITLPEGQIKIRVEALLETLLELF